VKGRSVFKACEYLQIGQEARTPARGCQSSFLGTGTGSQEDRNKAFFFYFYSQAQGAQSSILKVHNKINDELCPRMNVNWKEKMI